MSKDFPYITTGNRIQTRNRGTYIAVNELFRFYGEKYLNYSSYDLTTGRNTGLAPSAREWDIVAVYAGDQYHDFLDRSKLGRQIWQEIDEQEVIRQNRIAEIHSIRANLKKELDILGYNN